MTIQAVQHIRRMRGGAQSHLMRCVDGNFYVVEFQNNPQHTRVLVNDWLGTCLAALVGLSVPTPAIVEVHPWLIEHTPDLRFDLGGKQVMPPAGLCFGSRYVVPHDEGVVHDYLPEGSMSCVRNQSEFAGILALDKWTCNADGRQVAFWKRLRQRKLTASFIDQGYCFNAGEWSFPDAPLRGVFGRNDVYANVRGWESFEPWISRIENFSAIADLTQLSAGAVLALRIRIIGTISDNVRPASHPGTARCCATSSGGTSTSAAMFCSSPIIERGITAIFVSFEGSGADTSLNSVASRLRWSKRRNSTIAASISGGTPVLRNVSTVVCWRPP